jgi:hypothetical protein
MSKPPSKLALLRAATASVPEAPPTPASPNKPERTAERPVFLSVRVAPAVKRQLTVLGAEKDMYLQQLVGQALNLLFLKHGLPPIADESGSS